GQCLSIHRVVLSDELVQRENVRGQRVYFIVTERLRLPPWHSPPDVIEKGRRKWPEVRDGFLGLHGLNWFGTDQTHVRSALSVFTMARRAFGRIDARSVGGLAAAGRKTGAIGQNVDIPGSDFPRRDRFSKIWRLRKSGDRAGNQQAHDEAWRE